MTFKTHQSNVPAIIISGELNGLGVIRSLGRAGIVTYLLDCNRFNPGMWSRYVHPVLSQGLHGPQLIDALFELQNTLRGRPVLISTDEMAVLTISERREQLSHSSTRLASTNLRSRTVFPYRKAKSFERARISRDSVHFGCLLSSNPPINVTFTQKRHRGWY
jgi:hypothetical protein